MNDSLHGGCHESPLGYNNIDDWFVNEVLKLEFKTASILRTLRKISL